jgi:hypothetical protein
VVASDEGSTELRTINFAHVVSLKRTFAVCVCVCVCVCVSLFLAHAHSLSRTTTHACVATHTAPVNLCTWALGGIAPGFRFCHEELYNELCASISLFSVRSVRVRSHTR